MIFGKHKKMEKENNKEELNIDKLINCLNKYNYNYKTVNIDIKNKKNNYVILEINVINDDGNNIIKKRYKKYLKKYKRRNPISNKSLINLKYTKMADNNSIDEKQDNKEKINDNQIEIDTEELKISNLNLSKNMKIRERIEEYDSKNKYDKKEVIKKIDKNYNVENPNLYLWQRIIKYHKLDIYNNIIKEIKSFINLKRFNIINGTLWNNKDVECLLKLLLHRIDAIFTDYCYSLSIYRYHDSPILDVYCIHNNKR